MYRMQFCRGKFLYFKVTNILGFKKQTGLKFMFDTESVVSDPKKEHAIFIRLRLEKLYSVCGEGLEISFWKYFLINQLTYINF